mmetsp:Transcript_103225/g.287304  ORF Transcript_103225/g.287304 Transcript_103225/m.287304 type:complete len:204 (+) Transcript_103225:457-1068(+)
MRGGLALDRRRIPGAVFGHNLDRRRVSGAALRHDLHLLGLPLLDVRQATRREVLHRSGAAVSLHASPALLLKQEVVRGGHMVVLAHLQALHRIIAREAKAVQLLQHVLLQHALSTLTLPAVRRLGDLSVPCMVADPRDGGALLRVCGEHPRNHVAHTVRDVLWSLVVRIQDLAVERCCVLVLERQVAAHEREEDHATAPDVAT